MPYDLTNKAKVYELNPHIYVTRYVENAPSKVQTNIQENLLVIVIKGRKKLVCGEYMTILSEGEFGFFKKGNYIMNQILTSDNYESLLVFISDEYLREIMDQLKKKVPRQVFAQSPSYVQGNIGENLQYEVEQVLRLLSDETLNYGEILKLKIKEMILYLMHGIYSEQILDFIRVCVKETDDLRQYMENNYEQCRGLSTISKNLNMSVSTFKRKFFQLYGVSPGKWISNRRLLKAANLLRTTNYLVTDICFLCGFESVSAFNVQFKRRFNMTPRQYAKAIVC